ncbi:MAG: NYN domain-containing protein [Candidatus Omnitrophota bacterium]
MAVTLVVDGYNAINAIPETRRELEKSLYSARKMILAISREYARSSGFITDVVVVFDGSDRFRDMGMLRSSSEVFSGTGAGDDKIIETVKKYSSRGRVVIASNDNYVRNNSRAYGASPINVEEMVSAKKKRSATPEKHGKRIDPAVKEEITREYGRELGLAP